MGNAGDAEAAAEVLVILAVGHFVEIDHVAPTIVEQGLVIESHHMTIVIELGVVRQVFDLRLPLALLHQVAEFSACLQSAVG